MVILTGLWLRLSNNPPWIAPAFNLYEGWKTGVKAAFWFNVI